MMINLVEKVKASSNYIELALIIDYRTMMQAKMQQHRSAIRFPTILHWLAGRRRDLAICAVLMAISVAIDGTLLVQLLDLEALAPYDVLFDADPAKSQSAIAHGGSERVFVHPLFGLFFSPILRLIAALADILGLLDGDQAEFRMYLALFVTPILSALKTAVIYTLFRSLGLVAPQAGLLALLVLFSFSQIIFGTIPGTYGLSGLGLSLLLLQVVLAVRFPQWDRPLVWGLIGVILVGTTSTNVVLWVIGLWSTRVAQGRAPGPMLLKASAFGAIFAAAVVAAGYASHWIRPVSTRFSDNVFFVCVWLKRDLADIADAAVRFPIALRETLFAGIPDVYRHPWAPLFDNRVTIMFTYEGQTIGLGDLVFTTTVILALLGGGYFAWSKGGPWRAVSVTAAGVIVYSWVLHSIWGYQLFLYSQHWHAALVVLMSGWLVAPKPSLRKAGRVLIVVSVVAAATTGAAALSMMRDLLVKPATAHSELPMWDFGDRFETCQN